MLQKMMSDPDMLQKMMSDPKAMALMQQAQQNPKIMAALQDVQANGPSAMQKYAGDPKYTGDPEIQAVLKEVRCACFVPTCRVVTAD